MILWVLQKRSRQLRKKIPHAREWVDATFDRDEQGHLIVPVRLPAEPMDPYSCGRQTDLAPALYEYLDSRIYYIPVSETLNIRISGRPFTAEEQEHIRSCIQEHYRKIFRDKQQDLDINLATIFGLLLTGVLVLALVLSGMVKEALANETLSIIGSFAMWEAVDMYLLERRYRRAELFNACQSAMAEVTFEENIRQSENG